MACCPNRKPGNQSRFDGKAEKAERRSHQDLFNYLLRQIDKLCAEEVALYMRVYLAQEKLYCPRSPLRRPFSAGTLSHIMILPVFSV